MKTEDAIALFASRADMYRQVAQWFFAPLSEEQIDALASQGPAWPGRGGRVALCRWLQRFVPCPATAPYGYAPGSGCRFYGGVLRCDDRGRSDSPALRIAVPLRWRRTDGRVARRSVPDAQEGHGSKFTRASICPTTISRSTRPMRRSCAIARRPFSARATGLGRCKCSQSSERSSRSISPPGSTISEIGRRPWSRLASIRGY